MRAAACILMTVGIIVAASAAHTQFVVMRDSKERYILLPDESLVTNKEPAAFEYIRRSIMIDWMISAAAVIGSICLFSAARRQERLDPFSPEFDWKDEGPA